MNESTMYRVSWSTHILNESDPLDAARRARVQLADPSNTQALFVEDMGGTVVVVNCETKMITKFDGILPTRNDLPGMSADQLRLKLELCQGNYDTLRSSQLVQQKEYDEQGAELNQIQGDIGRLSDHYQNLMRECDAKDAEIDRLRAELSEANSIVAARARELDSLYANDQRLRAALRHLYEYAVEVEGAMTPWLATRPGMAELPGTQSERERLGNEVRALLPEITYDAPDVSPKLPNDVGKHD